MRCSRTGLLSLESPATLPILILHLTVESGEKAYAPLPWPGLWSLQTHLNQVSRAHQLPSILESWGCRLHSTLRGAPCYQCWADISKCSSTSAQTPLACPGSGFLRTRQEGVTAPTPRAWANSGRTGHRQSQDCRAPHGAAAIACWLRRRRKSLSPHLRAGARGHRRCARSPCVVSLFCAHVLLRQQPSEKHFH